MTKGIRKLFVVGALALCTGNALGASGQPVIDGSLEGALYVQDDDMATAQTLVAAASFPAGARIVLIQAEGDSIRWRDDGTDPTAAVGMLLEAGQTLVYNGVLTKIKIIEVSTNSIANITFYR